ncbi:hypothetical protein EZS27_037596, partial [termite gut metagenome]
NDIVHDIQILIMKHIAIVIAGFNIEFEYKITMNRIDNQMDKCLNTGKPNPAKSKTNATMLS